MFASVAADYLPTYTAQMGASLEDKLFFLPFVQADVYVDIGCADGQMMDKVARTGAHTVGFDLCPKACALARDKGHVVFDAWGDLLAHLALFQGQHIALLASSVIHEIYAYGGVSAGDTFWDRVNTGPWKTVIVRDMAVLRETRHRQNTILAHKVRRRAPAWQVRDFEARWGTLDTVETLTHFLLTYRYTENWSRELDENYLPLCVEEIDAHLKGWSPILSSHQVLPFLQTKLAQDMGISFPASTHIKRIVQR